VSERRERGARPRGERSVGQSRPGRAEEKERRRKAGWAGLHGRKKRERGKKMCWAKKEKKRERKEMHSNAFDFESEI
jgi:hypothetical protein